MKYGVLIANWNGAGFIERCLGSVMAAVRRVGEPVRVMVVDDASSDDSAGTIARQFRSAELLRLPGNVGFGRAVNAGMRALDTPWVFLLNNDLALAGDYFERLIEAKENLNHRDTEAQRRGEEIFAIGAKTLQWETHEPNHAGMRARWERGMIVQGPFDATELTPTDFVQGGSCLIDRGKFLELGGFCEIYYPGYWEDYDVAYQALKRGWKNYYEPRAVAYHWGKKSMRARLGDYRLALTIKRNHLLFNWANLTDGGLLRRHLLGLGGLVARDEGDQVTSAASWGRAVAAATAELPMVLRVRRERRRGGDAERIGDSQILE